MTLLETSSTWSLACIPEMQDIPWQDLVHVRHHNCPACAKARVLHLPDVLTQQNLAEDQADRGLLVCILILLPLLPACCSAACCVLQCCVLQCRSQSTVTKTHLWLLTEIYSVSICPAIHNFAGVKIVLEYGEYILLWGAVEQQ